MKKSFRSENRIGAFEEEKEEKEIEKLKRILKEIAEKQKEVPLDLGCRIKMEDFKDIYPLKEIEEDKEYVKEMEEKFNKEREEKYNQPLEEKLGTKGEKLEVLKNIIFYKFLREDFIICRSSRFDDFKNKIDNLILEKRTGNLVCALDEVEFPRLEEKKVDILKKNQRGGGRLKYGLTVKEGKIKLTKQKNLPVFFLYLTENQIREGIEKLEEDLSKSSDYEEQLFKCFKAEMIAQIERLKLEKLNPDFKKKLTLFEKTIF